MKPKSNQPKSGLGEHGLEEPAISPSSRLGNKLKGFSDKAQAKSKAEREKADARAHEAGARAQQQGHEKDMLAQQHAHQEKMAVLGHHINEMGKASDRAYEDKENKHGAALAHAQQAAGLGTQVHEHLSPYVAKAEPVNLHRPQEVRFDKAGAQFVGMPGRASASPEGKRAAPPSAPLAQVAQQHMENHPQGPLPDEHAPDVDRSTMHQVPSEGHRRLIGGQHKGALQIADTHFKQPVKEGHSVVMGSKMGRVVKVNRTNVNVKFDNEE